MTAQKFALRPTQGSSVVQYFPTPSELPDAPTGTHPPPASPL